jgi:hypothetical protein
VHRQGDQTAGKEHLVVPRLSTDRFVVIKQAMAANNHRIEVISDEKNLSTQHA